MPYPGVNLDTLSFGLLLHAKNIFWQIKNCYTSTEWIHSNIQATVELVEHAQIRSIIHPFVYCTKTKSSRM